LVKDYSNGEYAVWDARVPTMEKSCIQSWLTQEHSIAQGILKEANKSITTTNSNNRNAEKNNAFLKNNVFLDIFTSEKFEGVGDVVPMRLKEDREFMLEAVKRNGLTLNWASRELKADKEIAFEAVKQNGKALYYASDEMKNDKEVVMEAVKQNGYFINYASTELKANKEIALEVVKNDGRAISYVSDKLKNNPEIVLEAIKQNPTAIYNAGQAIKNEIGRHDPEKYIETHLLKNKFDNELQNKHEQKKQPTMKI
jgi:hypothetical protein